LHSGAFKSKKAVDLRLKKNSRPVPRLPPILQSDDFPLQADTPGNTTNSSLVTKRGEIHVEDGAHEGITSFIVHTFKSKATPSNDAELLNSPTCKVLTQFDQWISMTFP